MHATLTLPPGPSVARQQPACRDTVLRPMCVHHGHALPAPAWLPQQQLGDSWAPGPATWPVPQRSVIACAKRGPRPKSKPDSDAPDAAQSSKGPKDAWDMALSGVPIEEEGDEDLLDGEDEADLLSLTGANVDDEEDEDEDALDADLDEEEDDDEYETDELDAYGLASKSEASDSEAQQSYRIVERLSHDEALGRPIRPPVKLQMRQLSKEETERREAAEAAASAKAMVIPAGAQVTLNRQGYQTFQMDEVELLVAETSDGKLNLSDAFVYDPVLNVYAPPEVSGKLPRSPLTLQIVPWMVTKSPDSLKNKEAMQKLVKVYFIGVESQQPYRLALDQVFSFESSSRALKRESVWRAPDVKDPVLRIRKDGISIEDTAAIPSPHQVSTETDPDSLMSEEEKEARRQERLEELESQAEEVDELDEAPDVSAADMM